MREHSGKMTPEQILEAAKEEGYELSDDQLDGIAGGGQWRNDCCPSCGHTGTLYCPGTGESKCNHCGAKW